MIVQPSAEMLARAGAIIRQGGLVAFPTETVYGLGAHALDPEAVARIYHAKQRPFAIPLIVHVADVSMARALVLDWPAHAQQLADQFWPGPLTLVLHKAPVVPDLVTAGLDSVGLRIPAHPVALALIRAAGVPIAAPSANRFTQISPTTPQHVADGLADRVDLILDGGPSAVGIESTVAALHRSPPAILRPGMISQAELEAATGITWDREQDRPHLTEAAESPGSTPRHYAPRTPFYLVAPGAALPPGRGHILELPPNPADFARQLYARLHQADTEAQNEHWDWIAIHQPPDTPDWTAIRDRLQRAGNR